MKEVLKDLIKHKIGFISLLIIFILVILAMFAPYLFPYDPFEINVNEILLPPSLKHPLETDLLGRDVLSRMIYASRISLEVSLVTVGISVGVGVFRSLAGYLGSIVDQVISRFIDIMLCFPTIFLILAVIAYLEPPILTIMIVIGATSWMGIARLVMAEIMSLKEKNFVLIAKPMEQGL